MIIDYLLVSISWLVLLIYWVASAVDAKKTRTAPGTRRVGICVLVVLLVALVFRGKLFGSSEHYYMFARAHAILPTAGVILCIVGVLFAIRARMRLGKNWGMPQSVKEHPELIKSGPYEYVRHPIYTALLVALVGSSIVGGLPWLLITCACAFYFTYSAHIEEKIMLKEFPKEYSTYKKKAKMFVPFVF